MRLLLAAFASLLLGCAQARAQLPAPCQILVIGDSNTENGFITGELARNLENRFGYAGSGYHSLNAAVGTGAGYLPHLKITNDASWQPYVMVPGNKDAPAPYISPDGTAARSATPGAKTTAEFVGDAVDLYYLAAPGRGTFSVALDGGAAQVVDSVAAGREVRRVRVEKLKAGTHVLTATVETGGVTLLGIDARAEGRSKARAVVHKWGRGYATTQNFMDIDAGVFASGLKLLQPDVVVLLLGTNDHNITGTGWAGYTGNLVSLSARVRAALPGVPLLMVSTVDAGVGRSQQLRQSYLKALPGAAAASGAAYWDMATWFGPLKDHKDLAPDGLHVNEAGGAKIAAQLATEIAKAVEKPADAWPETFTLRGAAPTAMEGLKLGPRLWVAADGPLSLDGNGGVANWLDDSKTPTRRGAPAGAAQPVATARPRFVAEAINGKPALRFDGNSSFLHADFLDNGASTYIFVLRAANADGAVIGHSNAAIPSPDLLRGFAGEVWANGHQLQTPAALPLGQPLIVSATPTGVTPCFLLGLAQSATNEAATDRFFSGDLAEVLAFYPSLDDASRRAVEASLGRKYNIPLAPQ